MIYFLLNFNEPYSTASPTPIPPKHRKTSDSSSAAYGKTGGKTVKRYDNYSAIFQQEVQKHNVGKTRETLSARYVLHFRQWIQNESNATSQYRAVSTIYEEFDKLPNWHAFWMSTWPKIHESLRNIWYGGGQAGLSILRFLKNSFLR